MSGNRRRTSVSGTALLRVQSAPVRTLHSPPPQPPLERPRGGPRWGASSWPHGGGETSPLAPSARPSWCQLRVPRGDGQSVNTVSKATGGPESSARHPCGAPGKGEQDPAGRCTGEPSRHAQGAVWSVLESTRVPDHVVDAPSPSLSPHPTLAKQGPPLLTLHRALHGAAGAPTCFYSLFSKLLSVRPCWILCPSPTDCFTQ